MKQEWLVYRALSHNPSKELIADIVNYNKLSPNDELYILLWQLNPSTLNYIASISEYTDAIQESLCYVYDHKTLELLFEEVFKKWFTQCHIATHPFHDKDDLYSFFDAPSTLNIRKWDMEELASNGFGEDNIIISTSMVIPERKDLYFSFSAAKLMKDDPATAIITKAWYASAHWEGFKSLEWYLKNKLPKGHNLFDLLGLKARDYL